jgi:arylformamidase
VKIFDISVPVTPALSVWPGDPRVVLERFRKISDGNDSNDSKMVCSVHCGTHVETSAHFIENGSTIEGLSLDILIGSATVAGR